MKRYLLSISMLFAIGAYAQTVTRIDCGTCVGASNFVQVQDKPLTDTRDASVIAKESELTFINSEITNVILELRKLNIITLPKYVETNDHYTDKKNYLAELKKLLPEEKNK